MDATDLKQKLVETFQVIFGQLTGNGGEISAHVCSAPPPSEDVVELYLRCLNLNISGAKILIPFPRETERPPKFRMMVGVAARAARDIWSHMRQEKHIKTIKIN